ncbi:MAG: hypothetical protein IH986_02680 [Planctomycetes bacterium]|nr:hypothetical protein [Planctomycetota bacterium]
MANGYIPRPDAEFDGWQQNWVTYAAANAAALGLDPLVDIPAIQAGQTAWDADYDGHLTAAAAAQAARAAKVAERGSFETLLRSFSQQIQKRTGTTNEQRGGLGITILDTEPTPVPAPTTAPVLNIVTSERLRHVVEASKTALEGGGLGKPSGVRGVQLWRKIGDPAPVNESELEFVSEFTRTRMTLDYQMSQGGQTVHYQARWVSTRGASGPWGELVGATVVK